MSQVPYYHLYEFNHAAMGPARAAVDAARLCLENPFNPLGHTPVGRSMAAALEVFERATRRYAKPAFGITETMLRGAVKVPVVERVVWERPFARLLNFQRMAGTADRPDPKVLLVAPLSGHYATLLRGTVAAFLPDHDVSITDWTDARMVPLAEGGFDLDDYVDYLVSMLHRLGPDVHVVAVCQPAVPVLAAVALMNEDDDPCAPASMTLMGGPIDTRINPTEVDRVALDRGIDWFGRNVVMTVPPPNPGFMREVYPGFLQLSGFMSMNLERHITAHQEFFSHLVRGDGEPAEKHREFYDEYLAVMDMPAEFYLQTIETVFIRHALPKGEMTHRGRKVNPGAITRTALLTIEGENDDISGIGQTEAAHRLCTGLRDDQRAHYLQPTVGHYGVFNGSRFRAEIAPRMAEFIQTHDSRPRPRRVPKRAAP